MNNNFPEFFERDCYIVSEKVAVLKFTNSYDILSETGEIIGKVRQTMPTRHKFASLLLGGKSMMPFHFDIVDNSGNILVTIRRDWTFWLSKIAILYNEQEVAHINQKFAMMKPKFMIFENNGSQIGEIIGNWHAWNFKISDGAGKQIGKIDKKWNGVFKEGFTTADKYRVKIEKDVVENTQKIIITAAAIVVDMVLKEAK